MSPARDIILTTIRRGLGVSGVDEPRVLAVQSRLKSHPSTSVPMRGIGDAAHQLLCFKEWLGFASASCAEITSLNVLPEAISVYLTTQQLPLTLTHGQDKRLVNLPWARTPELTVTMGAAVNETAVGVSFANAAIAETGTLMMVSGTDNPTSLNFLPETHIIVVKIEDIVPNMEAAWVKLRAAFPNHLPHRVNLITGPSRSADIEQTLLLGAHGPRQLHVVIVN